MAIKKSDLEKKWYYRLAKTLFFILPLIILLLLLFNGGVSVCYVPQFSLLDLIQKYLVYFIIGLIIYFLLITAIWRLAVYVIFGGLEDDTKKKDEEQKTAATKSESNKRKTLIPFVILLIIMAIIFALYQLGKSDQNSIKINTNPTPTAKPGHTCYATSAGWGHPCHSVNGGIGVYGLPVPAYCNCPTDTNYVSDDNTAPGGPYKICVCK